MVYGRDTSNITPVLSRVSMPDLAKAGSSSCLVRFDAGLPALPSQLRASNGDAGVYNLLGRVAGKGIVKEGRLHMDASSPSVKSGLYLMMVVPRQRSIGTAGLNTPSGASKRRLDFCDLPDEDDWRMSEPLIDAD